jgi:hypothetical protein
VSAPPEFRFDPVQLAELARLIAVELRKAPAELVDAATLAELLGVSRDYVYDHKEHLGGVKLGDGPRARWRFDVERARAAMAERPKRAAPRQRRQRPVSSAPQSNGRAALQRPLPGTRR